MHGSHPVAPSRRWKVPPVHLSHVACPPTAAIVPGAHAVGATLPVGLKKPGSVSAHSAALVRLVMFEWRPSAQGSGADAPSLQKCPGVQLSHSVAPKALWCLPAGHLVQSACPVSALNVPGSQNAHEALLFAPTAALAFPTPQWRHASLELLPIKALNVPSGCSGAFECTREPFNMAHKDGLE